MQFRSLTDIVSVKRTLGGAFSVFGRRRVFRGVPVDEDDEEQGEQEGQDEHEEKTEETEEEKEEEGHGGEEEEGFGVAVEGVRVGTRDYDSTAPPSVAPGSSEPCVGRNGSAPDRSAQVSGIAANGHGDGAGGADNDGVRVSAARGTRNDVADAVGARAPRSPPADVAREGHGFDPDRPSSRPSPQSQRRGGVDEAN